jgi:hypothetical protein
MPDRVRGDLRARDERIERLGLGHLLCRELGRELLAEDLEVVGGRERAKLRQRLGRGRETAHERSGILKGVALHPVAGDHLGVRSPHPVQDRVRQAVRVICAPHPNRQVGIGEVGHRLVARPLLPVPGRGADLDVGYGTYRARPSKLPEKRTVVGRDGACRARVDEAVVDEAHPVGIRAQRVAHHGEPAARVRDEASLVGREALSQESDGALDVLLVRLVDECVVAESGRRPHHFV